MLDRVLERMVNQQDAQELFVEAAAREEKMNGWHRKRLVIIIIRLNQCERRSQDGSSG